MAGVGLGTGSSSGGQMSPDTARRIAALIAADAQQLEERAHEQGVTAFLGRAVKRERPNERFLQNTLRNLASANKRQDEKAMWAAWEAERDGQQGQQQHGSKRSREAINGHSTGTRYSRPVRPRSRSCNADRHRSRSSSGSPRQRADGRSSRGRGRSGSRDSSTSHSHSPARPHSRHRSRSRDRDRVKRNKADLPCAVVAAAAVAGADRPAAAHDSGEWSDGDAGADRRLLQWLGGSKAVKGRGSVGPHADVSGPYLPAPLNPEDLQQGSAKGPPKPSWLQGAADGGVRLKPSAAFLRGVLTAQGIAEGAGKTQAAAGVGLSGDDTAGRKGNSSSSSGSESSSDSDSSQRRRSSKKRKHKRSAGSKKHKKHKKPKHKSKKSRKH